MRQPIPWQTIGTDPDPPEGQWCVLLDADDPENSTIVCAVHGEDWEQAICGAFWSRHAGDRWLPLAATEPDHQCETCLAVMYGCSVHMCVECGKRCAADPHSAGCPAAGDA